MANVALAPGIGIARVPNAGRNFEYLCGEDPVVGAVLVKQAVRGIQSRGIIANAKHWVNNEIETDRKTVSANVDERTRFELYYPPFQAAVDAGVLSVMCAYNRINDQWACENPDTLGHLKKTMGFEGWVMSDWLATHSTVKSVKAGLDMEMPVGLWLSEHLMEKALADGSISEEDVNSAVVRTLTAMYTIGLFDRKPTAEFVDGVSMDSNEPVIYDSPTAPLGGFPLRNVTSPEHNQLAREIAAKSTVLLKNDGNILPFTSESVSPNSCIAVIGDQSVISGRGSGHVVPYYSVTQTQGIQNYLSAHAAFNGVTVVYNDGKNVTAAADIAASCSVAVVVVATSSGEGNDRSTLALGNNQDQLVTTVVAANPRTVVSVITPGAVLMPWADLVPSILVNWLPGQEAGNGLADVLFGEVNPYARLHVTMPNKDNEVQFTAEEYPGVGHPPEAEYHEQLLIGYRWYEAKGVKPVFPFGHGMSYSQFSYSLQPSATVNLDALTRISRMRAFEISRASESAVDVAFMLTNSGRVAGSEIVQLYLSFPSEAGEPLKQLKAFRKVTLAPGATQQVVLSLTTRDLSVWDVNNHNWRVSHGVFTAAIGASSVDIRCTVDFSV